MENLCTNDKELLEERLVEFTSVVRRTGGWWDYAGIVVLCNQEIITKTVAELAWKQGVVVYNGESDDNGECEVDSSEYDVDSGECDIYSGKYDVCSGDCDVCRVVTVM